jgi:hypothetical protein
MQTAQPENLAEHLLSCEQHAGYDTSRDTHIRIADFAINHGAAAGKR